MFSFGRLAPALAFGNLFFLLMGSISYLKCVLRGEPLLYADVAMIKEAMTVAGNMPIVENVTPLMMRAFLIMVVIIPLLCMATTFRVRRIVPRVLGMIVSFVLMTMVAGVAGRMDYRQFAVKLDDYSQRGLIVSFADEWINGEKLAMEEPVDYSQARIEQLLHDYQKGNTSASEMRPHILYVMSESLFDIERDLQLSEDPLAQFKLLQQEHWGGNFLTKVYGGATASVEYEVLTGYPLENTEGKAYNTSEGVIQRQMDSLISVLKDYGYFTQAIHPNNGGFYSRETVYSLMGFDSVWFAENMEKPPKEEFPFPSDAYLFHQIISAYESRVPEKPWFCHAITYQNHGGYGFESSLSKVRIEQELPQEKKRNANNYVNLLKLSDDALKDLIDYFDKQAEPIVIVVWGDHAPAMEQFGITLPDDEVEKMHYYTTPMLIYSNFDLDTSALPEQISGYRLSAFILHLLGLQADPYFNYLASKESVNLTRGHKLIECDGQYKVDDQRYDQEAEKLYLMQYDRVFGENYGKGE